MVIQATLDYVVRALNIGYSRRLATVRSASAKVDEASKFICSANVARLELLKLTSASDTALRLKSSLSQPGSSVSYR